MSKQERATRTRHALIQSAAHVFDQGGYSQARLEQVSQGAGVSRGALFFHFANKEALADAVEEAASRTLRAAAGDVYRRRGGALQALIDTTHALARLFSHDQVVRGGFQVNCHTNRGSGKPLREQWESYVGLLLREADAGNELLGSAPQRDIVETIVAATTGFQILGHHDEARLSAFALTRFWRLLLPRLATAEVLGSLRPDGSRSADHPAHSPRQQI
ncbi:ScbR family autoregulator-binding transcription factor [Streptomyces sp. NPDC088348]|uniref:ScbR family autoregulator-binding transcription factor n=1 Tax=Streptomyces sp. NPDC088348 TaxID=3365853 RepID=UPI0038083121